MVMTTTVNDVMVTATTITSIPNAQDIINRQSLTMATTKMTNINDDDNNHHCHYQCND